MSSVHSYVSYPGCRMTLAPLASPTLVVFGGVVLCVGCLPLSSSAIAASLSTISFTWLSSAATNFEIVAGSGGGSRLDR